MNYTFNELKGKYQGEMHIIEADSIEEAIKLFGADDCIRPHEKFKKMYFNLYSVYKTGHPEKVEYIVHREQKISKLSVIMREMKITSQTLAEQTGISKRTMDEYRQGRKNMSFENGMKISDALGIDPHELIGK